MKAVGVIGVGAMGMGVARALLARGFPVFVRDIVAAREAEAVANGARACRSPAEMARQCERIVTLVVNARQTREILFAEDGAVRGMERGGVVMMCSTIAPTDAAAIADQLARHDLAMLDAPVSGGPARAEAGTLSMMAAGSDAAFERAADVLAATATKLFRVGPRCGDGSKVKIVNNMLAGVNLAAGCEAMALGERLGLDTGMLYEVICASSGASWMFANRMKRALAEDWEPRAAARILTKDLQLLLDTAEAAGFNAEIARVAHAVFEDTVESGFGSEDDAAVLKRYRKRAP
jgi:3-hydroxyisobutyrate dehydrogenase-like beta-hydroxyacid dehydrogenase